MIDNIDYDHSSTIAEPDSVLNGTSISKLHHFTFYQDSTPKPNVFHKNTGKNTAKCLPTSLETLHGDGRRGNQLHLPSPFYITSHPMSPKLPVRSQCGCTRYYHPVKVLSKHAFLIAGVQEMLTCIPKLDEHLFATAKLYMTV